MAFALKAMAFALKAMARMASALKAMVSALLAMSLKMVFQHFEAGRPPLTTSCKTIQLG